MLDTSSKGRLPYYLVTVKGARVSDKSPNICSSSDPVCSSSAPARAALALMEAVLAAPIRALIFFWESNPICNGGGAGGASRLGCASRLGWVRRVGCLGHLAEKTNERGEIALKENEPIETLSAQ